MIAIVSDLKLSDLVIVVVKIIDSSSVCVSTYEPPNLQSVMIVIPEVKMEAKI